jgi:hypothetical protein
MAPTNEPQNPSGESPTPRRTYHASAVQPRHYGLSWARSNPQKLAPRDSLATRHAYAGPHSAPHHAQKELRARGRSLQARPVVRERASHSALHIMATRRDTPPKLPQLRRLPALPTITNRTPRVASTAERANVVSPETRSTHWPRHRWVERTAYRVRGSPSYATLVQWAMARIATTSIRPRALLPTKIAKSRSSAQRACVWAALDLAETHPRHLKACDPPNGRPMERRAATRERVGTATKVRQADAHPQGIHKSLVAPRTSHRREHTKPRWRHHLRPCIRT